MVGINEPLAGFAAAVPAIFEARDAALVEPDGAANAFGIALDAGLRPDQRDEGGKRHGNPPDGNTMEGVPDDSGRGKSDEQSQVAEAIPASSERLQALGARG